MNNDKVITYGFFCDIENPEYEHLYKYKTTSFNFNKNKKYKIIYEQKDIPCFPKNPFIKQNNQLHNNNSSSIDNTISELDDNYSDNDYVDSCLTSVCLVLTAFAISIYCIYYLP